MPLQVPDTSKPQIASTHAGYQNRVLATLPAEELALLRPYLSRVHLVASQVLYEPNTAPDAVYFLEQGIVALVAEAGEQETIEIAMVGCEGVRGTGVLLQPDIVLQYSNVVQVAGLAYKVQVANFLHVAAQTPTLRDACLCDLGATIRQIAQTSACNGRHDLPKRLSRLLLMVHDRVDGDDLPLTQNQIAHMMGVRRAGVSTFMSVMQDHGLLQQKRGRVTLLDREGLMARTCACYGKMRLDPAH
ncbi:MAG: Crp/Fnr family transcriptional regulator [Janthinobacterium lividum]